MKSSLRAARSPAAISIAGQKTAWNLRMSLPMMWNVAGQNSSVRSSPSRAKESAV